MQIKLNVAFRNVRDHKDSEKRMEHVMDRMQLRGIGKEQITEAIQRGAKSLRKDGSIICEYRWFRVVYREYIINNIRKVYPITVMDA